MGCHSISWNQTIVKGSECGKEQISQKEEARKILVTPGDQELWWLHFLPGFWILSLS